MKYTRDEFDDQPDDKNPRGYLCHHGMAPNGGGTKVNQFTMIMDMMIPDLHLGDGYNTVVKWEAVDDFTVDGSISIKANDIGGDNTGGIGISGQYTGDGTPGSRAVNGNARRGRRYVRRHSHHQLLSRWREVRPNDQWRPLGL